VIDELKNWLGLISLAITVGGWVWVHLTSGGSKALAAVSALGKSVDDRFSAVHAEVEARCDKIEAEQRIRAEAINQRFAMQELQFARMEEALKHLPDREQAHRLELSMEKLAGRLEAMDQRFTGRMEAMSERLQPVAAISDRLQEFLLDQASAKS
jgi:hypothetical protein